MSSIFTKKSLNKIESPEHLNEYIKVTSPSVWLLLSAIIILILGAFIWGIFGSLDSVVQTAVSCENGKVTCYLPEYYKEDIPDSFLLKIGDVQLVIDTIEDEPVNATDALSDYMMYLGGFEEDEWLYEASTMADLPDGDYEGQIVIRREQPISFVTN